MIEGGVLVAHVVEARLAHLECVEECAEVRSDDLVVDDEHELVQARLVHRHLAGQQAADLAERWQVHVVLLHLVRHRCYLLVYNNTKTVRIQHYNI